MPFIFVLNNFFFFLGGGGGALFIFSIIDCACKVNPVSWKYESIPNRTLRLCKVSKSGRRRFYFPWHKWNSVKDTIRGRFLLFEDKRDKIEATPVFSLCYFYDYFVNMSIDLDPEYFHSVGRLVSSCKISQSVRVNSQGNTFDGEFCQKSCQHLERRVSPLRDTLTLQRLRFEKFNT